MSFYWDNFDQMVLVHTFRHEIKVVKNVVTFSALHGHKITFDLKGAKIFGISATWWPWLDYQDCQILVGKGSSPPPLFINNNLFFQSKICQVSGILPEVIEGLEKMLNFTAVYDKVKLIFMLKSKKYLKFNFRSPTGSGASLP